MSVTFHTELPKIHAERLVTPRHMENHLAELRAANEHAHYKYDSSSNSIIHISYHNGYGDSVNESRVVVVKQGQWKVHASSVPHSWYYVNAGEVFERNDIPPGLLGKLPLMVKELVPSLKSNSDESASEPVLFD